MAKETEENGEQNGQEEWQSEVGNLRHKLGKSRVTSNSVELYRSKIAHQSEQEKHSKLSVYAAQELKSPR